MMAKERSRHTHVRIHHVSCTLHSPPAETADFEAAEFLARKLERYARRLGFEVMYENVDRDEEAER